VAQGTFGPVCVCALLRGASTGKLQEEWRNWGGSPPSTDSMRSPGARGGGTNRQSGKVNALQLLIIIMAASCWQLQHIHTKRSCCCPHIRTYTLYIRRMSCGDRATKGTLWHWRDIDTKCRLINLPLAESEKRIRKRFQCQVAVTLELWWYWWKKLRKGNKYSEYTHQHSMGLEL